MNRPALTVDMNDDVKHPYCVWQVMPHRLVIVYNNIGSDPTIHLEKWIGKDCMGNDRWDVDLSCAAVPKSLIRDFVLAFSDDPKILNNKA